jgi:hypothetical protein
VNEDLHAVLWQHPDPFQGLRAMDAGTIRRGGIHRMTEYLLTTSISLFGLSVSLYTIGYTYRVTQGWIEGLESFKWMGIGYEVDKNQ